MARAYRFNFTGSLGNDTQVHHRDFLEFGVVYQSLINPKVFVCRRNPPATRKWKIVNIEEGTLTFTDNLPHRVYRKTDYRIIHEPS